MRNVEDIYELSPLQHGMLFHTLYAPNSGAYVEQFSCRLALPLNLAAFKRAWQRVMERHAVLRTSFNWKDLDKPLQIVHQELKLPWEEHDWRKLSPVEVKERLDRYLASDRQRGFELAKAPLMRLTLFRMANAYHFVFSHHHILMDGWCGPLLMKEVLAYYEAFSHMEDANLPRPSPYRNYIAWLQKRDTAAAKRFWQRELAGFTTPTALGIDKLPGGLLHQEGTYADHIIELPSMITAALQSFAREHGLTFNTLVQAAWGLLLSHYSGQRDILFGTAVSGRPAELADVETMIGLFINTLPVRMQISPQARLLPWLKQVQERQAEMRQYEYTPLINIQGWSEIPRGVPLFESILAFENYPSLNNAASSSEAALNIGDFHAFEQTNYPLTLLVEPGTFLKIIYDTQRFADTDIDRLLQHFQNLLEGMVTLSPDVPLTDLSLLSQAERHQILVDWNATQADFPEALCIHTLFEAQVQRTPDVRAVAFKDQTLTYLQLNRKAGQLAGFLRSQGVGPEAVVGICVERSLDMMVGLLGILKAGGAYLPLDPMYPRERLAFMLEDGQANILLTQTALLDVLPDYKGQIVCLDAAEAIFAQGPAASLTSVGAENLAYLIYTSGSTGKPKGVQITHRAVVNLLESMYHRPGFNPQDVLLAVTTLSFDIAGLELFLPLITGGTVALASREEAADDVYLPALLKESQATIMQATPVTWKMLVDAQWPGDKNLIILCGGEALPGDLASQLLVRGKSLWNMYGPTETTIWSSIYPVTESSEKAISIGRPIANTEMYILDEQMNPVPIGVPGNLYIGGQGVARGYWRRPELTAEKFIPNPFQGHGARMYATGDLARYLPDGNIEFLGRIDHQVKLRGLRIELGEIESLLRQHPGVREGVVVARQDQNDQGQLVAYLVPNWDYQPPQADGTNDAEQALAWQSVWDEAYNRSAPAQDPTFDISGWNSSYTGQPIPAEEMREWVDSAVERILALRPQRALEIGCGTGLLLFRVAPACTQYQGTDFSARALEALQETVKAQGLSQVSLSQRMADDFSAIKPASLDTIIINSVIQYFPSADYLVRVLQGAVNAISEGGSVYVGDVRSLPLLKAFHTSIQLAHLSPNTPVDELRQRVQAGLAQEKELVVDPAFFFALKQHMPRIRRVEVLPKLGSAQNELNKFRYDVVLHIGESQSATLEPTWVSWNGQASMPAIRQILAGDDTGIIGIGRIPNARVLPEAQIAEWLGDGNRDGAINDWLVASEEQKGVDIAELRRLAVELNYILHLNWRGAGKAFDAVFCRSDVAASTPGNGCTLVAFPEEVVAARPWNEYTRAPVQRTAIRDLLLHLHQFLEDRLPEYMVPSPFIVLEKMPLTPNGKIDRRALPTPGSARPAEAGNFAAPATDTEGKLAKIWQRLLGVDKVGRDENFFGLGGHSLNAIQMVNRIRDNFNIEIPLRTSYEISTIAELAEHIDKMRAISQETPKDE